MQEEQSKNIVQRVILSPTRHLVIKRHKRSVLSAWYYFPQTKCDAFITISHHETERDFINRMLKKTQLDAVLFYA